MSRTDGDTDRRSGMPWTHVRGKAALGSFLLLLLTADRLLVSVPEGFEVSAVIRSTYHPEQGEPSIMEYTFEVIVHGCESRMRATGIPDPGVEFVEYGSYETGSSFLAQYRPESAPCL